MTKLEITNSTNKIYAALKNSRIFEAIKLLSTLLNNSSSWELKDEFERMRLEYSYMLKYFSTGTEDSSRETIYNNIVARLFILTDKVKCNLLAAQEYSLYYNTKKTYSSSSLDLENIMIEYCKILDSLNLYNEVENRDDNKVMALLKDKEKCENKLFNCIWTAFPTNNAFLLQIEKLMINDNVPIYTKSLIISAILLSLLEYYDENLLVILLKNYHNENIDISMKSLCAAVIILYIHRERIKQSSQIQNIINELCETLTFAKDFKTITFLLVRSKNTEKITKKVEGDLMPNLMKAYPKVFDKIKNDTPLDITDLESNPDWKDLMDDNILSKKIDELNKLQMEGADVFIGTFAHLKSFPFFNEISNWFLPFHNKHTLIKDIFNEKENALLSIISESKFFCDSDKYSFAASLASVPSSQRGMMLSQFSEQNTALDEFKQNGIETQSQTREDIANSYIQNIYRFFKLFPRKSEFVDPFRNDFDISVLYLITEKIDVLDSIEILANFYLKNEFYHKALKYFKILGENSDNVNPVYFQKIGFCYQNLEQYNEAINYYHRFALLSNNDLWNLRHLAVCYRAIKQPENALKHYLTADGLSPNNISICLNIGHCYLEIGNYEEALKYYFKVNYLEPNSLRSLRPIAWSLYVSGNYEQSKNYYNKIFDVKPNATDYLNYGHLMLSTNNIPDAIIAYKKAIGFAGNSIEKFIEDFTNDEDTLLKSGVKKSDISILLDSLLFETDA